MREEGKHVALVFRVIERRAHHIPAAFSMLGNARVMPCGHPVAAMLVRNRDELGDFARSIAADAGARRDTARIAFDEGSHHALLEGRRAVAHHMGYMQTLADRPCIPHGRFRTLVILEYARDADHVPAF